MRKNITYRLLFFSLFLIAIELFRFYDFNQKKIIGGDFTIKANDSELSILALAISILGWIILFLISILVSKNRGENFQIKKPGFIISIFLLNLILTQSLNLGNVLDKGTSKLSVLLTLFPINYFIFPLLFSKIDKIYKGLCLIIFIITDLFRILLGALFKSAFILWSLIGINQIKKIALLAPLFYILLFEAVEFKLNERTGNKNIITGELVLSTISSRIGVFDSTYYILDNSINLKTQCDTPEYNNFVQLAVLSVIPKKIFGLELNKSLNNCLIEHRLKKNIFGSTVNSPFIPSLFILKGRSTIIYLLIIIIPLLFIVRMSNRYFGDYSLIFNYWIFFEIIWTGNILTITIPLYFLLLIKIFNLWRNSTYRF